MKRRPDIYPVIVVFMVLQVWGCNRTDAPQTEKMYRFSETMTVDGRARTYTVNLPPTYYAGADFSLVLAMHGGGGDAGQFESTSKLTAKANAAQFIVVYPEGVKSTGILGARTWNAGGCCDYARDNAIDDVNFIRQLINRLAATHKINPKKIYATGHSNGGMLAYRLACELSDKIAAIAPNSCSMALKTCNPGRPVPVLHMHSVLDTKVPYRGGSGSGVGTAGVYFPPIDSVLTAWSLKNTCTTTAQVLINTGGYTFTKWSACRNNVTIQYYLTKDGGHAWPGGLPGSLNGDTPSNVINANDLMWDFFQQYQLP